VTKTCLSPTEAILSWKRSRNLSRWSFWNQFNSNLSLHQNCSVNCRVQGFWQVKVFI